MSARALIHTQYFNTLHSYAYVSTHWPHPAPLITHHYTPAPTFPFTGLTQLTAPLVPDTESTCPMMPGDGTGGPEVYVGSAVTSEECAALVQATWPTANGATYSANGDDACYAEFGMTGHNSNSDWQTCLFYHEGTFKRPSLAPSDKRSLAPSLCVCLCVSMCVCVCV